MEIAQEAGAIVVRIHLYIALNGSTRAHQKSKGLSAFRAVGNGCGAICNLYAECFDY